MEEKGKKQNETETNPTGALGSIGVASSFLSPRSLFEIKEARSCFRNRSYLVDYLGSLAMKEPGYSK